MKKNIDIRDFDLIIDLQDWLDDIGVKYKKNGTGSLVLDKCFSCGATEKLYINAKTGLYHCFKCENKKEFDGKGRGNALKLGHYLGNMSYKETIKKFYGITDEKQSATLKDIMADSGDLLKKRRKLQSELLVDPIELSSELEPLDKNKHPDAWKYLQGRGIDDLTIEKMGAFYRRWDKRVVNVVYKNGLTMGWVARDITGTSSKKVLNSPGRFRSVSIWNFDKVKLSEELVICEGIFSAVKCGIDRSVALLGKTATPHQIDLITENLELNKKPNKIYICLDIGTEDEQNKIYDQLVLQFPKSIFKIELPEIISLKKHPISEEMKSKIESVFKIKLEYSNLEKTELVYPLKTKKKIKLIFETKKNQFSEEEWKAVLFLAKESEYKDAGDYSQEQMQKFIDLAKPYKKAGLLS